MSRLQLGGLRTIEAPNGFTVPVISSRQLTPTSRAIEVFVFGPIGDFVLHESRPAILVAGGIGITRPSKAWPSRGLPRLRMIATD